MTKLYKILLYLTNNEHRSRDEVRFDIWFFLIMVLCVVVGVPWFIIMGEPHWSVLIIMWFIGYFDQIRHNRE